MRLKNPIIAKRVYLEILDLIPVIEVGIAGVDRSENRDFRDRAVVRLARLERNMAALRDALNDHNESKGD